MPVKDQAAYMREYRARKRTEAENALEATISAEADDIRATSELIAENARLTEEVARLKLELAARPDYTVENIHRVAEDFERRANELDASFRQFRPVPKTGAK